MPAVTRCQLQRPRIRIAVVSKVRLCRDGLCAVLATEADLHVVHSCAPSNGVAKEIITIGPDAVVVDLGSAEGRSSVAELGGCASGMPIIAIAVEDTTEQVLTCARHRVAAFVPANGSASELIETIRSVSRGEFAWSGHSAAMLYRQLMRMTNSPVPGRTLEGLTLREREVLDCIAKGRSNKEIARALSIEVATVKNHVHHILDKLKVQSRGQAASLLAGGH